VPKTELKFLLVVAHMELMKSMDKLIVNLVIMLVTIVLIILPVDLVLV
jgi:hypothetical protein